MVKTSHAWSIVSLLLVMLMSSAAWAATITGSVTNATGRTGRIFVVAELTSDHSRSFGTSLAAAGPFTISGVIPGTFVLHAFVDETHLTGTPGSAIQHANDPAGASAELVVGPNDTTVNAGTIALAAPTPAVAVRAPAMTVYGGSGANYVKWVGPTDTNGLPIAESYTVQWSDIQTAVTGQSAQVRSGFDDNFLHRGGGSALYYRVIAHVGGSTAPSEWVRVEPPAATLGSITGTVSFPGSATGPLFVAAVNESVDPPVVRVTAIASPTSPATYTLVSVPPGTYNILTFLDQNNSGTFDAGDAGMLDTNDYTPLARVADAQVTVPAIALEGGNAATIISTGHGKSATAEWFNLVLTAQSMRKQLVSATLTGPQLSQPVTLGLRKTGDFHTRIPMGRQTVGQAYTVVLGFSDNSTETVTEQVTGVQTDFATPTSPVGNLVFNPRPNFSWSAPSLPPSGGYLYSIWLTNATTGASVWTEWGLPSNTTSVAYGGPDLVDGTPYKWILNVTDAKGNMAAREVDFTTTSGPALSSFSPIGGAVGTEVTLTGVNFPTSPAPTVTFGTTAATVTAVTGTTITTSVPAGAVTGKITVTSNGTELTSKDDFYVGAPITVTGRVLTSAGAPVPSARVEVEESPTVSDTTNDTGNFTLQSVFPGQLVTLLITANDFVPTYSVMYPMNQVDNEFYRNGAMNLTAIPFHLYTQAQLSSWGVTSGRGMISGELLQLRDDRTFPPISGATVTTTPDYPVRYFNGTAVTGTSTAANGTFMVFDLPEIYVAAQGHRAAWTFYGGNYIVRAGSVTEGPILGQTDPPSIGSFTPIIGKRGSTVTINGVNFSPVAAENEVRFGTVLATVTSATATRLTVIVPDSAVTSDISVTKGGMQSILENQPFTVAQTLSIILTGAGTVNSDPGGITCSGTTGCSADFARGSTVRLFPTAEGGGSFNGWSGECTGTGICTVTMDADRRATATFSSGSTIRVGSTLYGTLAEAVSAAPPGSRIDVQSGSYPINNLIIDKTLNIVGGYDSTFATNSGFSNLLGTLLVRNGALRVDRIKVR